MARSYHSERDGRKIWSDIAAGRAKVSPNTVTRIEGGLPVNNSTMEAIRRVFEAVGVEFTNGDRPGVSLKKDMKG
jgi:hypothetical protein